VYDRAPVASKNRNRAFHYFNRIKVSSIVGYNVFATGKRVLGKKNRSRPERECQTFFARKMRD